MLQRITTVVTVFGTSLALCVSAFAAGNEKVDVKGMITSRTGETLIVKTADTHVTVFLNDNTVTKDDRGLFGLDKQQLSSIVLVPGLKVDIDGTVDYAGRVNAKTITVDGDDLETAEMIQAGLHPTAQQVAANVRAIEENRQSIEANRQDIEANRQGIEANRQDIAVNREKIDRNIKDIEEHTLRFTSLAEYDVKAEATLRFGVGSTNISTEDEAELKRVAQTATSLKGYIIEVVGYADSTGSAAINTKLSEDRAKAVITFLMQQCNVPIRHIIAPGAMGEYGPAASNETKAGRAENRRVEVKVLINKGIAGS